VIVGAIPRSVMLTSRYQFVLLGGLFIGVLSSLPMVSAANLCCCLWVVCGGLLTTYLQQQNQPEPVAASDAALSGLLAGLAGAVLQALALAVMMMFTGTIAQDQVRSALEANAQVPPAVRDFVLSMVASRLAVLFILVFTGPIFAVFSMLGALLGVAIFKKKTPPS
jgi:hypothetical protein